MNATLAAALAGAFVMASIVPVYFVWITPELFNFSLGISRLFLLALQGGGSREHAPRGTRWLFGGASDLAAALLLGIATFSKVTNALLFLPLVAWLLWRRRWRRAPSPPVSVFAARAPAACFCANMAISGEWNLPGRDDRYTYCLGVPVPEADVDVRSGPAEWPRRVACRIIFDRARVLRRT